MTDLPPESYVAEFQWEYLKGEIQFLTLQAAFSTRSNAYPVYAKKVEPKEKRVFRAAMTNYLERVSDEYIHGQVSGKQHCFHIEKLSRAMSTGRFSKLLHNGRFRIGVSQKALNLYLKYLWCLGKIPEPPHCPFDGIVIDKLDNCAGINWTEFDDTLTYEHLVHQARLKAGDLSLSEWELRVFSRR